LATAVLGAVLPGFLHVTWNVKGVAIRAAGALAVFVVTFFGTPKVLPNLNAELAALSQKTEEAFSLLNSKFDTLLRSLDALMTAVDRQSRTVAERNVARDLIGQRDRVKEEWRDLSTRYSETSRTNAGTSSVVLKQKLVVQMDEIVQKLEIINQTLAAMENKFRAPPPPENLKIVAPPAPEDLRVATPGNPGPSVSLTSPANGSTVSDTTSFVAAASGDISKIEFYEDNVVTPVGVVTSPPYSIALNTAASSNGSHSFYCKVYDKSGNFVNSETILVTVRNADK